MSSGWAATLTVLDFTLITGLIFFIFVLKSIFCSRQNPSRLPIVNDRKWYEFGYGKAKHRYNTQAEYLVRSGFEKCEDAFFLFTDSQLVMVLAPKYADVLRNENRLDLGKSLSTMFHEGIPGFEPLSSLGLDDKLIQKMIRFNLSRSLGTLIEPLSKEATHALQRRWADESEWHTIGINDACNRIVSQVSTRVFLNNDICRDQAWLNLAVQFSKDLLSAMRILRFWPKAIRLFASWYLPCCRKIRAELREAERRLEPIITDRRHNVSLNGKSKPGEADTGSLDWLMDIEKDLSAKQFTEVQLGLFIVASDSTSEVLSNILCDLSDNPKLIDDIRAEIFDVVGNEELNQQLLSKLHLMESAMKESQRLRPSAFLGMQRYAKEKVVLPDGLVIPKGTWSMVSAYHTMDASTWPGGDKYDGYRFFNMRKTSASPASCNFVTTSENYLGFGHGKQACPGRFFADKVIKVLLCHILLNYDFKAVVPEQGRSVKYGHNILPHPDIKFKVKRRSECETIKLAPRFPVANYR